MKYELLIFDCDGTLVDSESLLNKALSEILQDLGYKEYTHEFCMEEFVGHSSADIEKYLLARHPEMPIRDIEDKFLKLASHLVPLELKPMPGAVELLANIEHLPKALVSNGENPIVKYSLEVTELKKYFPDDVIFTYDMVGKPKPDPELFFCAAKRFNVKPEKCLVIEDSVAGMQGAKAAGMDTVAMVCYPNPGVLAETKNGKVISVINDLQLLERVLQ
jgi:HAD superfamily hydrolase (TIGR01509 family)